MHKILRCLLLVTFIFEKVWYGESWRETIRAVLLVHETFVALQHSNTWLNPLIQRLDRDYGIAMLQKNQHMVISLVLVEYWVRESLVMMLIYGGYFPEGGKLLVRLASVVIPYHIVYHLMKSGTIFAEAAGKAANPTIGIFSILIDHWHFDTKASFLRSIIRSSLQGIDTMTHWMALIILLKSSGHFKICGSVFIIWIGHQVNVFMSGRSTATGKVEFLRQHIQKEPNVRLTMVKDPESVPELVKPIDEALKVDRVLLVHMAYPSDFIYCWAFGKTLARLDPTAETRQFFHPTATWTVCFLQALFCPFLYVYSLLLCFLMPVSYTQALQRYECDGEHIEVWGLPLCGWHYHAFPKRCERVILQAALLAKRRGAHVLCLGGMNKAAWIWGGGADLVDEVDNETGELVFPSEKMQIVDGNRLTCACVISQIEAFVANHQGPAPRTVYIVGAGSKIGQGIAEHILRGDSKMLAQIQTVQCGSDSRKRYERWARTMVKSNTKPTATALQYVSTDSLTKPIRRAYFQQLYKFMPKRMQKKLKPSESDLPDAQFSSATHDVLEQKALWVICKRGDFYVPAPGSIVADITYPKCNWRSQKEELLHFVPHCGFMTQDHAKYMFACLTRGLCLQIGASQRHELGGGYTCKDLASDLDVCSAKRWFPYVPVLPPSVSSDDCESIGTLIVGAGPAGLLVAERLTKGGMTDFIVCDAQEKVGGSWQPLSQAQEGMHLTTSAKCLDFLPGIRTLDCSAEISFAILRDLIVSMSPQEDRLRLRKKLVRIHPREGDNIEAVFADVGGEEKTFYCRQLVLALGKHCVLNPYRLQIQDSKATPTLVQHIHDLNYALPKHFWGKRILVVGSGNSALEFAGLWSEAHIQCDVHMSMRRCPLVVPLAVSCLSGSFFADFSWNRMLLEDFHPLLDIMPSTMKDFVLWCVSEFVAETNIERYVPDTRVRFPYRSKSSICFNKFRVSQKIQAGKIAAHPPIHQINEQGVMFTDGSLLEGVELIVLCTGYDKPTFDGQSCTHQRVHFCSLDDNMKCSVPLKKVYLDASTIAQQILQAEQHLGRAACPVQARDSEQWTTAFQIVVAALKAVLVITCHLLWNRWIRTSAHSIARDQRLEAAVGIRAGKAL